MRTTGLTLTALLLAAPAALAQPAVPGAPVVGQPPAAAQPDPKLDPHLVEWEKRMTGVINFRTEVTLTRTDFVTKKALNFTGSVLCMKPRFAILRLDNTADPTKTDYEAYICDGNAVYAYNGVAKSITEFELPKNGPGVDNLMLDFLAGMKAKDVKERFDITLFKTDDNYIYLDIKPRLGKDQTEFLHLRLALYGPGPNTAKVAYLPAQVFMLKPNQDTEVWKFSNPQVDVPGVDAKLFKFVPVQGWQLQKAPAKPIGGGPVPAGGVAPKGGLVRP